MFQNTSRIFQKVCFRKLVLKAHFKKYLTYLKNLLMKSYSGNCFKNFKNLVSAETSNSKVTFKKAKMVILKIKRVK